MVLFSAQQGLSDRLLGAGLVGAAFLSGLYLDLVSLAESPQHAPEPFREERPFVTPTVLGCGTRVGLFTFPKKGPFVPMANPVNGATAAAGGGVSTRVMVFCCAHHVTDVLPALGLMLREIRQARGHALACAAAPAVQEEISMTVL